MLKKIYLLLLLCGWIPMTHAGFGNPHDAIKYIKQVQGDPCECKGGLISSYSPRGPYQTKDCGDKKAYLNLASHDYSNGEINKWRCIIKPKPIPPVNGKPGPCPNECGVPLQSVHSACYSQYQVCTHTDGNIYFTTKIDGHHGGSFGGDWSTNVNPLQPGGSKFMTLPCPSGGSTVCWNRAPPVHVSDGGGPQDMVRELEVKKTIEKIIRDSYPELLYHPLLRPSNQKTQTIETVTMDLISSAHLLLNNSNPGLAFNCWLCLKQGPPTPSAIYLPSYTPNPNKKTCIPTPPFRVDPQLSQYSPADTGLNITCFYKPYYDKTKVLDVGNQSLCQTFILVSDTLCADNATVFVCGDNLAYTSLPKNWTGTCMASFLLPDISVIRGDTPVPIPTFEHIVGRPYSLLATLGITAAIGTGSTGLGVAVFKYKEISRQLIQDVQILASTIQDIQDQVDSLAEVVLQNRRGLDLLTAEQGGICLALGEQCCFYANKSGIFRDRVKKLQEDLEERRRQFTDNPLWTGLGGVLPYLLPFLGLFLGLLILLLLGPFLFIKQQVDSIMARPIQVHYHHLDLQDRGLDEYIETTPYSDMVAPRHPPRSSGTQISRPHSPLALGKSGSFTRKVLLMLRSLQ